MDLPGSAKKHSRSDSPNVGSSPRVLVVMYHYVHDRKPFVPGAASAKADGICGLTADQFTAQIQQLGRELEPIDWPSLYAWSNGRGTIPERCFLLTFDDGLDDHWKTVVPILQEFSLRGTFFVPGSILASSRHDAFPDQQIHPRTGALYSKQT